jgi:hypothetical protein
MTTDLKKNKVVKYLYTPYSMKELKGLLGLTGAITGSSLEVLVLLANHSLNY